MPICQQPLKIKKNKIKLRKANCLAHCIPRLVFVVLSTINIYVQWGKPGQIRRRKRALLKSKLPQVTVGLDFCFITNLIGTKQCSHKAHQCFLFTMLKNQMFEHSKLVKSMFTLCSLITENDYLINKEAQPGRNASIC